VEGSKGDTSEFIMDNPYTGLDPKNVFFEVGDIRDMEFEDNSFDVIYQRRHRSNYQIGRNKFKV